ncbi:methyl-accepting chemotaxis protein [Pyrococcus kukulkanii]|uniref:methyl-accepting chemotaxis protein n=1 Tax=Pyrococcus kukulkanii TaxID=1609559 RepID=UPI0035624C45
MEFKKKIIGIVIVALFLVTVISGGIMVYTGNRMANLIQEKMAPIIQQQAKDSAMATAKAVAKDFDGFFGEVEALGDVAKGAVFASLQQMEEFYNIEFGAPGYDKVLKPVLLDHFKLIKDAEPKLAYVYFGDINGNMYMYPEEPLPEGYDPRVRPWYKAAVEAKKPVWSEPYRDASTGKWVITYAIPIYRDGKLLGVIGLDVFIDTLVQTIKQVKVGQTGYVYVVGEDGTIYMHPKEEYIMKLNVFKEPSLKPVAEIIQSGKEKGVVVYTFKGVEAVAAGVKIKSTGWYVFAKVPVSEISQAVITVVKDTQKSTQKTALMLTGIILLISLAMIVISYRLIARSMKPLEQLRAIAQALADGKLSEVRERLAKIRYLESDEIGALIRAFEAVGKDMIGALQAISKRLERLAEGDLSNGLSVEAKGELREVIEDVKTVTEKLKETMGALVEMTNELEKKANVLAQVANDVTEAINQVTEAIQQVSTEAQRQQETINEITEGVRLVSQVSEESVRAMDEFEAAVNEVVNIANEGSKKGDEALQRITDIQEMMNAIEESVSKVAEMSRNIEEITNVITNIAEQTNLLALNAAIEAARAGEAGRGFAVVAQEIRKLAEESKQAADNIKSIIDQITDEIREAVETTKKGVQVIGESSDTLKDSISYLGNIAELLQETSERMGNVKSQILRTQEEIEKALRALENLAASAEETTASAEEVSSAMEEQTAAIEELRRASQDLKDIVERLRTVISKFKL